MELDNLKIGQDVYYIDKSEGPGVVEYIHGTVISASGSKVTLEISKAGWLVSAGDEEPWSLNYQQGDTLSVDIEGRYKSILTPAEFTALGKEYAPAVAPAPVAKPKQEEIVEDEDELAKTPEELDEAQRRKEESPEVVEEGNPEGYEENYEEEYGLHLAASLDSWSRSPGVDIYWPEGFLETYGPQLEKVYEGIPKGTKGTTQNALPPSARGKEVSKSGPGSNYELPTVAIPGGKGAGVPPHLREFTEEVIKGAPPGVQEEFNVASEAVQKAKDAEETARKDADENPQLEQKWKFKKQELRDAVKQFTDVNKKLQKLLKRPPQGDKKQRQPENTFTQVPGRRAPYDIGMRGRAGLREELRTLSDKYRKTHELLEEVEEKEDNVSNGSREIDIIKNLRRNRLRGTPVEGLEYALKKLKFQEYAQNPYLWSSSRNTRKGENPLISERDRILNAATYGEVPNKGEAKQSTPDQLYKEKVGGARTFFDLTPEEISHFSKMDAKKFGPLPLEDIKSRAWKYAEEYITLVDEQVGWKDLSDEIRDYVRANYHIVISPERADRLEHEIYDKTIKEVSAKGHDTETKEIVERKIPVSEIHNNVIKRTKNNFTKRIKWLENLQKQREKDLAVEKGKVRRYLVEKKDNKEGLIDDQKYTEAVLALFRKYAKASHESVEENEKNLPHPYEVEHSYRAYEEKLNECKDLNAELTKLNDELENLKQQRRAAYLPYKNALGELELRQDDIGRLSDPDESQGRVLQGIMAASDRLTREIEKQVSRREILLNFFKNRKDWQGKVQKGLHTIDSAIAGLENERTRLFKAEMEPPKVADEIRHLDEIVKQELAKWTDTERKLDKQVGMIYDKRNEVEQKKSKLQDLGIVCEEEK